MQDQPSPPLPQPVAELLPQAMQLHQQGRLREAAAVYDAIIATEPAHFNALHLRGVVALQAGDTQRGFEMVRQAVGLNPASAAAHNNLGNALKTLGRMEEALASYDQALALQPDYAEACNNRGLVLKGLNRLEAAVASFDQAIALRPDYADAHSNRATALKEQDRLEEAVAGYDRALELRPGQATDRFNATHLRGILALKAGEYERGIELIDQALLIDGTAAAAHNNRGNAFMLLQRQEEALASYDRALALKPDHAEALYNRGLMLNKLKRFEEAAASFDRVLALKPGYAEAHCNRGNALREMGRLEEALAGYVRALACKPDFALAHFNQGIALSELGLLEAAIASYEKAIACDPDHAEARGGKGMSLLALGRLAEGFEFYEWRKNLTDPRRERAYPQPQWAGQRDLAGKTLFIHWEQGLGDTVQFCRFVPLARQSGARVVFAAQNVLLPLLQPLAAEVELLGGREEPASFDYHIPLLSLPGALGITMADLPRAIPYLAAEPARVAAWRERLGGHGFRIGICWQGSTNRIDRGRSPPLAAFQPLAAIPGVRLISLHKGSGEAQLEALPAGMAVETLGEAFDPPGAAFLDTAAVMQACDLVISSDTAVAHLAGAMGLPTWVALKQVPDWRWMLGREDSPWYPGMRLFRQQQAGDWAGVFARMAAALRPLVPAAGGAAPRIPTSWGEVVDKVTILEIKAARLENAQALANVRRELAALGEVLDQGLPASPALAALRAQLRQVNERLWDIEDAIRAKEHAGAFDAGFIELARSVYRVNDQRARLKREFNALTASELVEEKSYQPYERAPA